MKDVIYNRTFDASCMKRAGEDEWAEQIINRLKANNPSLTNEIDSMYNGYLSLPYADYIQVRTDYMLQHKGTMKLKFR